MSEYNCQYCFDMLRIYFCLNCTKRELDDLGICDTCAMLGERQDVSGLVCEECKRFTELKGNLPNSIKNKIELLKGNFISLEISDNISKKHLQILRKRIDELITDVYEKKNK